MARSPRSDTVSADGALGYEDFTLADPHRVVLDLPGVNEEIARVLHERGLHTLEDVAGATHATLLEVPGAKSDVAMLECFASEMFARRGTYGWNGGWAGSRTRPGSGPG